MAVSAEIIVNGAPLNVGRHAVSVIWIFDRFSFLSSMASARPRFSFPFSSCGVFRRLASETSIQSNFAFQ